MPLKKKETKKKAIKRPAVKRKVLKKKLVKKSPAKKLLKPVKKAAVAKKTEGKVIGIVTHYFPKVRAAVVKMKALLSLGDTVKFKGHTTDFKQNVTSMQIDRVPIQSAKKGQEIGLLVNSRARQHDLVMKV